MQLKCKKYETNIDDVVKSWSQNWSLFDIVRNILHLSKNDFESRIYTNGDYFVWFRHIHKTPLQIWRALSFTLCVFCTTIVSCSLSLKERIYVTSFSSIIKDWYSDHRQVSNGLLVHYSDHHSNSRQKCVNF